MHIYLIQEKCFAYNIYLNVFFVNINCIISFIIFLYISIFLRYIFYVKLIILYLPRKRASRTTLAMIEVIVLKNIDATTNS